jgi:hypothetical protein
MIALAHELNREAQPFCFQKYDNGNDNAKLGRR